MHKIIEQLQKRNFVEAIQLCKTALKHNNNPQIHLFLAIALGETNNFNQAKSIFEKLSLNFPHNTEVLYNFAIALEKNRFPKEAINTYLKCLSVNPSQPLCLNNLGQLYQALNQPQNAIPYYERALKIDPQNSKIIRNLAYCLLATKQNLPAIHYLKTLFHSNKANENDCENFLLTLSQLGLFHEIATVSESILAQFPNNIHLHNLVGTAFIQLKEHLRAIETLKKCLKINPSHTQTMYNLISAYAMAGEYKKLNKLVKQVTKKNNQETLIFICSIYEKLFKLKKAKYYCLKGLKKYPQNAELHYVKAKLLRHKKKYTKALTSIKTALSLCDNKNLQADLLFEKSQILNKKHQYEEAFKTAQKANNIRVKLLPSSSTKHQYIQTCQRVSDSFKKYSAQKPFDSEQKNGEDLIFIFGFPRSGTTLLDSILSACKDTVILEETPIIKDLFNRINHQDPGQYFKQISSLTEQQKTDLRTTYYSSIGKYINWKKGQTVVDKSPMNTSLIGFIYTLFPHAKFVFSERHPLDICVSCFFQNFKSSAFLMNLATLSDTAKTYNAMLTVWQTTVDTMQIKVHHQSYEKLVSNFSKEVRQLINFLGIAWDENILNYQNNLKTRGVIPNPSYDQVNQPIYQTAKNRYKNYLPHLDEAIEILQPWIERFGYTV